MSSDARFTLTNDELTIMSLFQGITNINPIACKIIDDYVYILIKEEDIYSILSDPILRREIMGRMSGRFNRDKVLRVLSKMLSENLNKNIYVVLYYQDPIKFIRRFFGLNASSEVTINESNGKKYITIYVPPNRKGAVIGRGGVRARAGRLFCKALYGIERINIR